MDTGELVGDIVVLAVADRILNGKNKGRRKKQKKQKGLLQ